ncbi:hypothetical protein OF83DRAFT_1037726, partial [Amylostereum chailletii]
GSFRAVVTDGISIGHPCCGMHNCTVPLTNNRDNFCRFHQDEASICAITTCRNSVRPGHRTCSVSEHQELEDYRDARGKAFFQLQ